MVIKHICATQEKAQSELKQIAEHAREVSDNVRETEMSVCYRAGAWYYQYLIEEHEVE